MSVATPESDAAGSNLQVDNASMHELSMSDSISVEQVLVFFVYRVRFFAGDRQ